MTAPNRKCLPPGCGLYWSKAWFWSLDGESTRYGNFGHEPLRELAIAAAWSAYDRIHGKPDHSGAPNDMTRELAEALDNVMAWGLECPYDGLQGRAQFDKDMDAARAVLEKWRATRKDKP